MKKKGSMGIKKIDRDEVVKLPTLLGQLIRTVRMEKNWSLREMGRVIGISYVSLKRFESGCMPNLSSLKKIASGVDMSMIDLLIFCHIVEEEPILEHVRSRVDKMTEDEKKKMLKLLDVIFED